MARSAALPAAVVSAALVVALASRLASADPPLFLRPEAAAYFQRLLPPMSGRSVDIALSPDHASYRVAQRGASVEIEAIEASRCAEPVGPLCLRVAATHGPGADELAALVLAELKRAAGLGPSPCVAPAGSPVESPWVAPAAPPVDEAPDGNSPSSPRPFWRLAGRSFLAVVLTSAVIALVRIRRELVTKAAAVPAALFFVALALRLVAHAGPGDIRDVVGMLELRGRAGWASYLSLVFTVLPSVEESIWNLHRVLGAMAVPLLFVVLRARFSALAATAGAATLAALPLVVRFDASDTQYVPLCTAFLAAIVALDRFARGRSPWTLTLALGLLTVAIELRPDGPWLVVPAAILFASHRVAWRSLVRPSTLAVLGGFVAVNLPFAAWALRSPGGGGELASAELRSFIVVGAVFFGPWFDLAVSPITVTSLVLAGGVVAARAGRSGVSWLVACVVAEPIATGCLGQLAHARIHLPAVHLACGLCGLAIAALIEALERRRGAPLHPHLALTLAVVLPMLAAAPCAGVLFRMWTPQLEFERFRASMRALGNKPTIVTLLHSLDGGLVPFADPGSAEILDLADYDAEPLPASRSAYYYRAANCFVADAVDPQRGPFHAEGGCLAFESRYELAPVWEADLPAVPYRGERYARDPVPVGLYRIVGPRAR